MNRHDILFANDDAWSAVTVCDGDVHVAAVPRNDDASLEAYAAAVRQHLADHGYTGGPVALALPSAWCLCAVIGTDELERGGRRRAMGFRLEEHLPISSEDVVGDYVDTGTGEALGVCAELDRLGAIVRALEAAGVRVRHICPAAILAAAWAAEQYPGVAAVLVCGGGRDEAPAAPEYDFVELQNGRPVRWWWLAANDAAVSERLAACAATGDPSPRVAVIGPGDAPHTWDAAGADLEPVSPAVGGEQAAALRATALLEGSASPWIDLRRDALAPPDPYQVYRRPVGALVAAAAVLLIGLSGVMQWRGRQYAALGRRYVQQQVDVFKEALPNQRVPGSVRNRLVSERRKLADLGGPSAPDSGTQAAAAVSALEHLRRVLASLPKDLRYRILDLNIQPDLIRVDGEALSHVEAERLAVALRDTGLYEVEPPKTQALKDHGVSFLFTAKPRPGLTAVREAE